MLHNSPLPQTAKKQHFVPQKSLERFSSKPGKIFVFDKWDDRSFENAISKTACVQYFYDMKSVDRDPSKPENYQISEKAFKEVEDLGQPIIDMLISKVNAFIEKKTLPYKSERLLYKQERIKLGFFLAVQYLRTPDKKEESIAFARASLKAHYIAELQASGVEITEEQDFDVQLSKEAQAGHHVLSTFNSGIAAGPELHKFVWMFSATNNRKLITCDTPVLFVPRAEDENGGQGILSKGSQLMINLSPNVHLSLLERSFFREFTKTDGKCMRLRDEGVDYINRMNLYHSNRYLYSPTNEFDWARELLAKNPSWRKRNTPRLQASGPFSDGINRLFQDSYEPQYVLFWGKDEDSGEIT